MPPVQGSPPLPLPAQAEPPRLPFPPTQDTKLEHSCGTPNASASSSFTNYANPAAGGEAEHHTPQWGCPGVHLHPSQDRRPGPHV